MKINHLLLSMNSNLKAAENTIVRRLDRFPVKLFLMLILVTTAAFRFDGLYIKYSEKIRSVLLMPEKERLWSLIYFDIFILIAAASLILGGLILFAGAPDSKKETFFIRPLRGRPVIVFFLFALLGLFFWGGAPTFLARAFLSFTPTLMDPIDTKSTYLPVAVFCSVSLALAFADVAARPRRFRYWMVPFFFIPWSGADAMPLVFWNAGMGMAPSRLWKWVKPLFIAAACLPSILEFPISQPIQGDYPSYEANRSRYLVTPKEPCVKPAYQVETADGGDTVYLRCLNQLWDYKRTGDGWSRQRTWDAFYNWDRAAFDPVRRRAFVYARYSHTLYAVDTTPGKEFTTLDSLSVDQMEGMYLGSKVHANLLWDAQRNRLFFLNDERGILSIYAMTDPDAPPKFSSMKLIAHVSCGANGLFNTVMFHPERDEILVLQIGKLTVIKSDGTVLRELPSFNTPAGEMKLDSKTNRLIIAFPEKSAVGVFDRDTLGIVGTGDAPSGVRSLDIDEDRRLIFQGSTSGAMEIRSLDDFRPVGRIRVYPLIHWVRVNAKYQEVTLTFADVPPVTLRYDQMIVSYNVFDVLQRGLESILRRFYRDKTIFRE